jgi:hypothetical protein
MVIDVHSDNSSKRSTSLSILTYEIPLLSLIFFSFFYVFFVRKDKHHHRLIILVWGIYSILKAIKPDAL